jgi:nucleotide-binding universal stress UspA family protein
MPLCDILACLDATPAGEGRLELALTLAQANKARLTAVYLLPEAGERSTPPAGVGLPPTILGPVSPEGAALIGGLPTNAAAPVAQVVRAAERADAVEARFRQELQDRAVDGDWRVVDKADLEELAQLAKSADLIVLGQYPGTDSDGPTWLRPDDLMIDSGRPVLIVPYAGAFANVGGRVLVAWDGTREANRALHDALPLLGAAQAVTVMHIGTHQADLDRDRPWLERVVSHLGRHGIKAQPEESPAADIAIGDVLLSRAADLGADMLVAGAYHHSPLRERLLGGVSRALLDHMTVPVLMSH